MSKNDKKVPFMTFARNEGPLGFFQKRFQGFISGFFKSLRGKLIFSALLGQQKSQFCQAM